MTLAYDTEIHMDQGRQDGDAITPWMVFCWARGEGVKPVPRAGARTSGEGRMGRGSAGSGGCKGYLPCTPIRASASGIAGSRYRGRFPGAYDWMKRSTA